MKQQVFNPYLPSWEYIPDGEPRLFGDRVYVYGSHDDPGGPADCICWSAPAENLSDWRYEGVVYPQAHNPFMPSARFLSAPDVVQGSDGRYYLYHCFGFLGEMGVAVCDTPAGKYEFYGKVRFPDGSVWGRNPGDQLPSDPGVLIDDDGRVYLYSGFAGEVPFSAFHRRDLRNDGGVVMELERDMVTIKAGPEVLFPAKGKPGAFPDHAFFSASSIRKVDGKYCLVYASEHNHDLCYAVSNRPKGPFSFGGVLIDQGDLYVDGNDDESHAYNYLGSSHGGLLNIGEDWYVFYHRQTDRSSRLGQACAEKLERRRDGWFRQAKITSCGLNGGPLRAEGRYEARIACNLWSQDGTGRYDCKTPHIAFRGHPYFTRSSKNREGCGDQCIANMRAGAVAGFKSFRFNGAETAVSVETRGAEDGRFIVLDAEGMVAAVPVNGTGELKIAPGVHPLFFVYEGKGKVDFISFTIHGGS